MLAKNQKLLREERLKQKDILSDLKRRQRAEVSTSKYTVLNLLFFNMFVHDVYLLIFISTMTIRIVTFED